MFAVPCIDSLFKIGISTRMNGGTIAASRSIHGNAVLSATGGRVFYFRGFDQFTRGLALPLTNCFTCTERRTQQIGQRRRLTTRTRRIFFGVRPTAESGAELLSGASPRISRYIDSGIFRQKPGIKS